jgi:hypothetical protein
MKEEFTAQCGKRERVRRPVPRVRDRRQGRTRDEALDNFRGN